MTTRVFIASAQKLLLADFISPEALARTLRRADDFIKLAVVNAHEAIVEAPARTLEPEEIGIFIGTAYGPLETNFCSLGSLIIDGEGQISPTLFSHSVYNSAAGYIARLLNIHGPALTLTTYTWPFLTALNQARLALVCRRIQRAVVVGVETYSALLEDAYKRLLGKDEVPWKPGSVAWVLDPGNQAPKGSLLLGEIVIQEEPCEPGALLSRIGECWQGEGLVPGETNHPMAYAFSLTDALSGIARAMGNDMRYAIKAAFGKAQLEIASQI